MAGEHESKTGPPTSSCHTGQSLMPGLPSGHPDLPPPAARCSDWRKLSIVQEGCLQRRCRRRLAQEAGLRDCAAARAAKNKSQQVRGRKSPAGTQPCLVGCQLAMHRLPLSCTCVRQAPARGRGRSRCQWCCLPLQRQACMQALPLRTHRTRCQAAPLCCNVRLACEATCLQAKTQQAPLPCCSVRGVCEPTWFMAE